MGFRQLRRRFTKRYRTSQGSESAENPISQLVTSMLPRRVTAVVAPSPEMSSTTKPPAEKPKEEIAGKTEVTEKPKTELPKTEPTEKSNAEIIEKPQTESVEKPDDEAVEDPKTETEEKPKEEKSGDEKTAPKSEAETAEPPKEQKPEEKPKILIHSPKVEISIQKRDDHSDDYHSASEDIKSDEETVQSVVEKPLPKVSGAPPPPPPPPPMSLREPSIRSIRIGPRVQTAEETKKPEEVNKSGLRRPNAAAIPADLMTELQNRLATRVRTETIFETEPKKPDQVAAPSLLKPPIPSTPKVIPQRPTAIPIQRPMGIPTPKTAMVSRSEFEEMHRCFMTALSDHFTILQSAMKDEIKKVAERLEKAVKRKKSKKSAKKSKKSTTSSSSDTLSAHSLDSLH